MTFAKFLGVLPALGLLGCVSDFSPQPYNQNPNQLTNPDGGKDAGRGASDAAPVEGPPDAVVAPPPDTGIVTQPAACDLSGRWIMTERTKTVAIGARQVSSYWHYVELEQQGDSVTMKRTLFCGGTTMQAPEEILPANVNDMAAWPAYQRLANYNGRKGSSKESAGGCDVAFDKAALPRGMTAGVYSDPSVPLPTVMQQGTASSPGWEDWDNDSHPGVTMTVSGIADGKLFTVFRTIGSMNGTVDANAAHFQLGYDWSQERTVYDTDPAFARALLASDAQVYADDSANFVEFARLSADQAAGSDDAACEAIRNLAPTLNPAGNPAR